jgi:hypothetical protein
MAYDDLKKALERFPQATDEDGPDFELVDCSQEPLFQVMAFLESKPKLGPAGRSLYNALTGYRPLSQPQEELLHKVLAKMQHPEWLEPILQEMDSTISALAACDRECSLKPEGWHLPGPWGLQNQ